jgi:bacillithiol biosynthesis cysteine-adding enzyme BshC
LDIDLAASGLLPPLPSAFLAGRDLDLLAPLRFVPPGGMPDLGPAPSRRPDARRDLAEGLAVANRGYGHPDADRLAGLLADPGVRVVVTGQQPGLLGGPLYAFAKAVAAARWAAALEEQGERVVSVYWVATEDHDWAEVSSIVVPTADGPRAFDLGPDPEPLTPVGMRTFGPALQEVLRTLAETVPGDRYAEWIQEVGRWYKPDARFGEAFSRLLVRLMGSRAPLFLDAMHPALKAAERPWLRRVIERRRDFEEAITAREAEIQRRGHPLQVTPQPGASPLFLLSKGERRRIEWRGDGWRLRGREDAGGTIEELLRIVDENPGVVSPGVMARAAIQDAVLGTSLQVLGPGELSYMAQAGAGYPVLEVEAPWVALRPQTLVLESHLIDKLAETGVSLADLTGDTQRLDRALAALEGDGFVAPVRQRIEQALDDLRAPALASDPNLERPLDKTREQILRALDMFGEKATTAAARRNEVRNRRAQQIREASLPLGQRQERSVAAAHFQGKYGDRFLESFWEQLDLDPRRLHVISP